MTNLFYTVAGTQFQLLPERAVFWADESALLISDPHFGKASAFRHAGIPVPHGTTPADLLRLTALLAQTAARRLIVLGDFFHHRTGQCDRTMSLLTKWREAHQDLEIQVVLGNHDRHSQLPPPEWGFRIEERPVARGPFLLCHEPCQNEDLYVLSGHIHPAIRLSDSRGHGLTVPCFYFGKLHAMLPAFGGFTGTARVRPETGDTVFALADGEVIPIRNWD